MLKCEQKNECVYFIEEETQMSLNTWRDSHACMHAKSLQPCLTL